MFHILYFREYFQSPGQLLIKLGGNERIVLAGNSELSAVISSQMHGDGANL
jgi:hypothetical protein